MTNLVRHFYRKLGLRMLLSNLTGEEIYWLRTEFRGKRTLKDFAEDLGISKAELIKLESGEQPVTRSMSKLVILWLAVNNCDGDYGFVVEALEERRILAIIAEGNGITYGYNKLTDGPACFSAGKKTIEEMRKLEEFGEVDEIEFVRSELKE